MNQTCHELFQRILPTDKLEIDEFESAFYRAFISIGDSILIRRIWDWNDENRKLRLKISYEDLVVLRWKSVEGRINCAVAANLNNFSTQFSEFGFSFPVHLPKPHCEIVTLFTNWEDRKSAITLNRNFLKAYCIPFMAELGYRSLYSTCAIKPMKTYIRWGWDVIDETFIDGEKRYLLHYNIDFNLKACQP